MFSSRKLTIVLLSFSAISAIYFIIILQFHNGTMRILDSYASKTPQFLPPGPAGNEIPLRYTYTYILPLDMLINRLTPFFWVLVSGVMPELSLFGIYMAGQLFATETVLIIEGEREGNKGRVISYSTVWGLVWQNLPWGLIQPIYNLVHLSTASKLSSTASWEAPTPASVIGKSKAISAIPLSIIIGYVLPSVLMCLPSPEVVSHEMHQAFVFGWQIFPLWIGITHFILKKFISASPTKSPIDALRKAYTFGLFVAASTHIAILSLSLALTYSSLASPVYHQLRSLIPPSFFPTKNPSMIFVPFPPFTEKQVDHVAVGILSLLQYDTIFAGFSSLLWATYLYSRVPQNTPAKSKWILGYICQPAIYTVLFGPCGATLATMWKRDEEICQRRERKVK